MVYMYCGRYESESTCKFFEDTPLVYGLVLIPATCLRIIKDKSSQSVIGRVSRDIHLATLVLSVFFVSGWLFDTNMSNPIELLTGVTLVDMVTIGLCCIIWIISIDKIRTILAEQQKSINPTWPVLLLAALAIVSTCLAIGLNILNWISDQLWTRGFFFTFGLLSSSPLELVRLRY